MLVKNVGFFPVFISFSTFRREKLPFKDVF